MHCFLVHFYADNIFVFNFKYSIFTKLTMGVTWFLVQELHKQIPITSFFFNCGNPLKSTVCSIFIMKFAVSRAIRGKNHQLFRCFQRFFLRCFLVKIPDCIANIINCFITFGAKRVYLQLKLRNIDSMLQWIRFLSYSITYFKSG